MAAKEALPPGVLPHITDTDPPPVNPRTVVVPGVGMHVASDEEVVAAAKAEAEKAKAEEHKPAAHAEHRAAEATVHVTVHRH